MNKASAASVASALVTAGYIASVSADGPGGSYRVVASDPAGKPIAASAVSTFATNNSVTGQVYSAEFV